MKFVLASQNQHKLKEMQDILSAQRNIRKNMGPVKRNDATGKRIVDFDTRQIAGS